MIRPGKWSWGSRSDDTNGRGGTKWVRFKRERDEFATDLCARGLLPAATTNAVQQGKGSTMQIVVTLKDETSISFLVEDQKEIPDAIEAARVFLGGGRPGLKVARAATIKKVAASAAKKKPAAAAAAKKQDRAIGEKCLACLAVTGVPMATGEVVAMLLSQGTTETKANVNATLSYHARQGNCLRPEKGKYQVKK